MFDYPMVLIRVAQLGDPEAIEEFIILLRRDISCIAIKELPVDSESFTTDAMVKVLGSLQKFQWQCSFHDWVMEIVHYEILCTTYKEVYERLRPNVYKIILVKFLTSSIDSLRSNAEVEAEEVTDKVFDQFWGKYKVKEIPRNKKEFDEFVESKCKRLVFTIAIRRSIDRIRMHQRRQIYCTLDHSNIESDEPLPDQPIMDQEREHHIQSVLAKLSETERLVIKMRIYEGLSFKEIAHRLDTNNVGYLRVKFDRILEKLQRLMSIDPIFRSFFS